MRFRALRVLSTSFAFAIALAAAPRAGAVEPVPPVPHKQGTQGPREGFATARLRVPAVPSTYDRARAPLSGQAIPNDVLAIRVAFSDTPIDSSTAYYDRLLLFLSQYWGQATDGLVPINPTLVDSVFTLPHPMSYYGDDARFQERLVNLLQDVVAAADSTVDFRNRALVIFHAGRGQEADVLDDSRDELWSAFVTQDDIATIAPDSTGAVGIATNDLIAPGVRYRLKEAVEVPESESQDGYTFGMTGVLCHEFGHQLGLPDLYDTTPDENGNNQGLGAWDIMAGGVWNYNGFVPAGPSAWSRLFLGTLTPALALADGTITLSRLAPPVGSEARAIQIPETQTEYLLLENRDQDPNRNGKFDFDDQNADGLFDFYTDSYAGAEFDFYLPGEGSGSGMTVYHVDESKIAAGLRANVVDGDTQRKGVDIVEADGIEDLDAPPTSLNAGSPDDVFRGGYRDRLTPDTTPSTAAYGNVRTGISITNISAADSLMTFDFALDRTRPGFPKLLSGLVRGVATAAADIDGDGKDELLVPIQRLNNTGALYIFREDGTNFLGGGTTPTPFVTLSSTRIASSPCVGDIDGFLGKEIVFMAANGAVYAFHADGSEVADGDGNPGTVGVLVGGGGVATRAQPILVDLDGVPGLEIVVGSTGSPIGGSLLTAVKVSGTTVTKYVVPMPSSTDLPPAAADLNGDGLPEVVVVNNAITGGGVEEPNPSGISIANWEIFTDPNLPRDTDNFDLYFIRAGGPFGAPLLADLDRNGNYDAVVADRQGRFHALRFDFLAHVPGDPPSAYIVASELPGWPVTASAGGGAIEVSAGDLEHDGYPEIFQTGEDARVTALHWDGAPRSGYPLRAGDPLAPADTAGTWAPLVADVDGNGLLDVIPILPDGRRPAYRRDGAPIHSFAELGTTGKGAPPILDDLDRDGSAEWVETIDLSTQCAVIVRETGVSVAAGTIAWGQWRLDATRNAVVVNGPAVPSGGTSILSEVYAYPNPARGSATTIHYRLSGPASAVRVQIFDPAGGLVGEPPTGEADRAGSAEHAVIWNHAAMASGVYLCRVEVSSPAGSEVRLARLAVIR